MGLIRFVLAAAVVIWHGGGITGWYPYNGTACVTLFFIVSGFYMALVLNEKYRAPEDNATFWVNRFLRLWPLFALSSLLMLPQNSEILTLHERQISIASLAAIYVSNITMIGYEAQDLLCLVSGSLGLCSEPEARSLKTFFPLPQGWSLGLELWFYFLAPFFVRRFSSTLLAFVIAALLMLLSRWLGVQEVFTFRFFPNVLGYFALGALAYWVGRRFSLNSFATYRIAGRFTLVLTVLALVVPDVLSPFASPENYNKIFLGLFAASIPAWFAETRASKWDNFVGELSYPMYVIHLLCIGWLARLGIPSEWMGFLGLASTTAASLLLNYVVDQPIDQLRQSLLRRSRPAPLSTTAHR